VNALSMIMYSLPAPRRREIGNLTELPAVVKVKYPQFVGAKGVQLGYAPASFNSREVVWGSLTAYASHQSLFPV
jgi:hypothetical protein